MDLLEVKLTKDGYDLQRLSSLEFLTLGLALIEPPQFINYSVGFPLQLWRQLFCDLTSLTRKGIIDFLVCLAFYLLGQNGDFYIPYMIEQKSKLLVNFFISIIIIFNSGISM